MSAELVNLAIQRLPQISCTLKVKVKCGVVYLCHIMGIVVNLCSSYPDITMRWMA
jgi:hypothetical protein